MTKRELTQRMTLGTAAAALLAASLAAALPAPALAQPRYAPLIEPSTDTQLYVGAGRLFPVRGTMSDVFVADDRVADVQVRSTNQLYVFGKAPGETTVYATNAAGKVLFSTTVRVDVNVRGIRSMLDLAMPDSQLEVATMNNMVVLTGTVPTPGDVEESSRLVQKFVGEQVQVLSRVKTATPMQVMLKVKIAEVSRSLMRNIGVNLASQDRSGGNTGFVFGRGRNIGQFNDTGGFTFTTPENQNSFGLRLSDFLGTGLDIAGALDLNETSGLVTTLAEPTLTALSGETASFLAGGEIPIPIGNGVNGTSIDYKQFGVSLAFTPLVVEGGRISMRVRPEVSELSNANGVRLNGFNVPGIVSRRAETTVELGSGQSFMIAGLLRNNASNSIEKAPFLGDIPILGALFRSNGFQRDETELVIVVTPYLVKPVNARDIALPTDGFRYSNDTQRILLDQREDGRTGERRPAPVLAPPAPAVPSVGQVGSAQPVRPAGPPAQQTAQPKATAATPRTAQAKPSAAPGFSF
jgi:pilus assembly protein CpaC